MNIKKVFMHRYTWTCWLFIAGCCVDLETGYITEKTRQLGLSVLRGTAIILISPFDGMKEIENPFAE